MYSYTVTDSDSSQKEQEAARDVVDFLYEHLDEYGDSKKDITRCLEYALSDAEGLGGFVVIARDESGQVCGTVIMNETGMGGYIPENLLVYIAVHGDHRGKGLGKELMRLSLERAKGDIALHVEPHNPAKFLYEKIGFTNKYLEMRLKR